MHTCIIHIYIYAKINMGVYIYMCSRHIHVDRAAGPEMLFLRNFVLNNMETICTVACRDSGKTVIDAMEAWQVENAWDS